jgi:polyferredoxin
MNKIGKFIINKRFPVLVVLGVAIYVFVSRFHVSLWYILAAGAVSGAILGKVFCRWACPMGIIMEILMSASGDAKVSQLYQYHKIGCPIAWVSGFLNKFSLFKINNKIDECKKCGICDKKCYVAVMEPQKFSLYKEGMSRPGDSHTCSRCLECVTSCPTGSLKYGVRFGGKKNAK